MAILLVAHEALTTAYINDVDGLAIVVTNQPVIARGGLPVSVRKRTIS